MPTAANPPRFIPKADTTTGSEAPSPRAWLITFMLFGSMALNFIDRMVLANVAPSLRTELHLSNTQYSYIVFAFMAGMTLGQLPVGMITDRIGARLALPGILTGWSVVNMLHAAARGLGSLSCLRFVMGTFECGNYSSAVKLIGAMMPASRRALALAVMDSGSLVGSTIAPPIVVLILSHYGWRSAFFLPSILGLAWLVPWFRICPPERLMTTEAGRRTRGTGPSLTELLSRRQTWGVIMMRALGGPVSQFYWYWLPLYLVRGRGLSLQGMAALSSLAFFIGGTGSIIGGFLSGFLIERGATVNAARKITFTVGCALAAASVLVPIVPDIRLAIALVVLAIFGLNFGSCIQIAVISDVFPESTLARVTGLSGIGEGVFNMVLMVATGVVVDRFSYLPIFLGAGLMPLGSIAALFLLVGPVRRLTFSSNQRLAEL